MIEKEFALAAFPLPRHHCMLYKTSRSPLRSSRPQGRDVYIDFYEVVQLRNSNLFRALRQLQTQNNILKKHLNLTINNCLNNKRKSILSDYWLSTIPVI